MVDLTPLSPCAGLLPLQVGDLLLAEVDVGIITAIMPYAGQGAALSDAMQTAHGLGFPAPNCSVGTDTARCVWTGMDQAMLLGPAPDASLAGHAALVDQSDAWSVVQIKGTDGVDVLARLTPIDLRQSQFGTGATARTLIGHMTASVTRIGPNLFQIMVFRSMAQTLVHELETAMRQLTARRNL